jgi:predicted nuclease with TOPRIM domain
MATPPADLVLDHLRADLAEIKQDMAEARQRLGHLEAQYATTPGRLDRLAGDVSRIRDRLGLIEA